MMNVRFFLPTFVASSFFFASSHAFVPHHAIVTPKPFPLRPAFTMPPPTTTALSADLVGTIASEPALIAGFTMICMATFPYVLGVMMPGTMYNLFFVPIYKDDDIVDVTAVRNAEIYWKLLYCTLGLTLTIQTFGEAIATDRNAIEILKDTYIAWAVFYTFALLKIRYEATSLDILAGSRMGIQVWHALVVIVLWLSVAGSQGLINVFDQLFDYDKLTEFLYSIFGASLVV